MKNSDVIERWIDGKIASGDNIHTDGTKLYSYAACIGIIDRINKCAFICKAGQYSVTTSRHSNVAARELAKNFPDYTIERVSADVLNSLNKK